jgi:hypothetical protein
VRRRRRRRIACNSTNLSIHLVRQQFSSAYMRDGNSEKNGNPGDERFVFGNTDLLLNYAQTSSIPEVAILVSVFASYGRAHNVVICGGKAF